MTSEPFDEKKTKGVKFWGKKGWIEVARGYFNASDPKLMPAKKEEASGPYETKIPHQVNFVEAVRAHKDPVVPVEIGHSSLYGLYFGQHCLPAEKNRQMGSCQTGIH